MDSRFWAFVVVATLLVITPGADTLLVVRNVLARGRAAALATVAGIASGCVVHAVLSAVGVSLILVRSAEAFAVLKVCGAVYLLVLGLHSMRSWRRAGVRPAAEAGAGSAAEMVDSSRRLRSLVEGLLTNVLNPKVGIFYLAFLPQFIGPGDQVIRRSLLLAAIHIGIGVVWLCVVSLGVGRIRPLLERPLWRARLEGVSGAVLIGLGLRLAAERR
ncbi:MAG TPA: LysE family translocator [Vicinamibacteria bacterium]|nr:LysE family translocator [Vicinamibacteria bacterium]